MPQIYVFVAGNPDAQRRVADTIENPVDEEFVPDLAMKVLRQID